MKRTSLVLAVLMSVVLLSVSLASAFQVCWRLQTGGTPPVDLADFLQVSAEETNTDPLIYEIHASLTAFNYHMGGAGMVTQYVRDLTKYLVTLSTTHPNSSFFNGNETCSMTMLLNAVEGPEYLNGTFKSQCTGGPSGSANPSGKVRFVACPVLPPIQPQRRVAQQMRSLNEADIVASQQAQPSFTDEEFCTRFLAIGCGNFETLAPE